MPLARAMARMGCGYFGVIQDGNFVEYGKNENWSDQSGEDDEYKSNDRAPNVPGARQTADNTKSELRLRVPPKTIPTRSPLT